MTAAEGYTELGMFAEAHEQLDLADARGDFRLEVAIRKLDLFLLEKRWKEAVIYGEILTEFLPEEPEYYMKYATALHALGRTDRAIHVLWLAAYETDPAAQVERDPEYQFRLANYELEAGTREDALLHLENAIALEPKLRSRAWLSPKLRPLIAELPWVPRFVPSQPECVADLPELRERQTRDEPFAEAGEIAEAGFPDAEFGIEFEAQDEGWEEPDFEVPF